MGPVTITRQMLQQKLSSWASGVLPATEFHKWVLDLQLDGPCEFDDWETSEAGTFSVSKETVAELEMLDMNFIISDDIPIFTDFLATPIGGFGDAYIRLIARIQEIDTDQRMKDLKKIEPYARHCV
jgi:hypothetical protein